MSTAINKEIIKAREIVAGYKELNKNTVEEISYYDPILRLRRYKKVSIDSNSKDFIKLYGRKQNEKKEKPIKPVKFVKPVIDKPIKIKVVKPKIKAVKKVVKKVAKKPIVKKEKPVKVIAPKKPREFNPESLTSQVYAMHLDNLSNEEIALKLDISIKRVRVFISARKNKLGLNKDGRRNDTAELIKKYLAEGKTCAEAADLAGTNVKNVYSHIYYSKGIEAVHKEILELARKKCKLHGTDYFYTVWISPVNNVYKNKVTRYTVVPRCDEMVAKGLLRDSGEDKKTKLGKKYYINIA